MARVEFQEFPQVGKGFRVTTQSIPPAGLVTVMRASRGEKHNLYRYSANGGRTFTEWEELSLSAKDKLGKLTDSVDLVLDFVTDPYRPQVQRRARMIDPYQEPLSSIVYDKSVFKTFFDSNDPQVLAWAINVLEKLFEPGIIPLYVSRDNKDDYSTFFFTITHFFAFIVVYARQFRQLENSDLLMKEFIEGWGLVYENINTLEQRQYLFRNWIDQFRKRGTYQIIETGETIEGELRRLVGYTRPNEFIFGVLAPQDVGWCMGWSSPTWYGTETVNAVSKGYDFGPDYAGDNYGESVSFGSDEIELPNTGAAAENRIITNFPWEILLEGDDVPSDLMQAANIGVGPLTDYPILGTVERKFQDNMYVLKPAGTGRSGVDSEVDTSKVMEVYMGLDYEVTVWVKADSPGAQNIEFGVNCYDVNMTLLKQVRITDFKETNSFFLGDRYQSPCKVPGIYYRLRGIVYNISEGEERDLYLNFENGRPLRFIGDVRYMAPYIVQNRNGDVADISIAGVVLKPLSLPFSQGYLGQKNVIAMYAQIRSARTKKDIEEFVRRYLVSYKNVVSYTWLDWVTRSSWFLTFDVSETLNGNKIDGAFVELSNGFQAYTDAEGYVRFEVPFDAVLNWTVSNKGVTKSGSVTMDKDQKIEVQLTVPLFVEIEKIQPEWGSVNITGNRLGDGWAPRSEVTLNAIPEPGYTFVKYVIVTDGTEDTRNPTNYFLGDHDIVVQAIFERAGELRFEPAEVVIPATGGITSTLAISTKKWALDSLPSDWASVEPVTGDPGETPIKIEIDQQG